MNKCIPGALYFWLNMAVYASYTFTADYLRDRWGIELFKFGYLSGLTALSVIGSIWWIGKVQGNGRLHLMTSCATYVALFCGLKVVHYAFGVNNSDGLPWYLHAYLVMTFVLMSVCTGALYPLLDAQIIASKVSECGQPMVYGKTRLWGTLGQGLITLLNGVIISQSSLRYECMFLTVFACGSIFICLAYFGLKETDKPSENTSQKQPASSTWVVCRRLLASGPFAFFLAVSFVGGLGRAVLGNFLPSFLRDNFRQKPHHIGLVLVMRVGPEVAILYFSHPWLMQAIGPDCMFVAGQVASALRALAYTYFSSNNLPALCSIEVLKGINNGMQLSAGVYLARQLATEETAGTALSLYAGIFGSVANATAGLVSGAVLQYRLYIKHKYNPPSSSIVKSLKDDPEALRLMFKWTSWSLLAMCAVYTIVRRTSIYISLFSAKTGPQAEESPLHQSTTPLPK